jgi:hypothetical protein
MNRPGSTTGVVFVGTYLVAYIWAWVDAYRPRGTWMGDILIAILAVPYTLMGRMLTGNDTFEFNAFDPLDFFLAAVLCSVIVYLIGWSMAAALRWMLNRN